MTDPTQQTPNADEPADGGGTGVKRPDQGGTTQPGQTPAKPAPGGEGAAGGGGPDGFGTGT